MSKLITSDLTVEVGPRAAPATVYFVGMHARCQVVSELHALVDSSWRGIHSDSFPSGSTPVLPNSHHSLELDLGGSTPTTGEQTP